MKIFFEDNSDKRVNFVYLKGLCHDLRGFQAKRTFWLESEIKEKQGGRDIRYNLLFSYWLLLLLGR